MPARRLRLRFGDAILHDFETIAARERASRAGPAGLQDDVRVHEYGAKVRRHFTDRSRYRIETQLVAVVHVLMAQRDSERPLRR